MRKPIDTVEGCMSPSKGMLSLVLLARLTLLVGPLPCLQVGGAREALRITRPYVGELYAAENKNQRTEEGLPSDEYPIYSAAINQLYDKVYEKRIKLLVMADQTEDKEYLKRRFRIRIAYSLVSKNELDALLYGPYKDAFFKRYRNSPGYIVLSGISLNATKSEAKLNIAVECGFLCGTGWYFRLTKSERTWTVQEAKVSWQK